MKLISAIKTVFLISFTGVKAVAQEGEPVLASVTYEFIHVNDTGNRNNPIREEMILRLGKTSSKYTSYSIESRMIKARKQREAASAGGGPVRVVSGGPLAVVNGPGVTTVTLFQHPQEGKLNKVASIGMAEYLIELTLPKIDWKIGKETRNIGGYTCQKAIGNYAGRSYAAWFTTDLPFQNGPWKLSGLPGLILEAKDAKEEVLFLFKEISKDTANQSTGIPMARLVKVSEKAFDRASEAWLQDPAGAMKSQMPAGATAIPRLSYRDSTGKSTIGDDANLLIEKYRKETQERNNNPIELIKP
jgi:GLPGLI family protein